MPWAIRMLLIMTAVALPLTVYVALRVSASVGLLRPTQNAAQRGSLSS